MKVYLAGPITGLKFGDSNDWRVEVKEQLAKHNILGFSPLRAKDYLANEQVIKDTYDYNIGHLGDVLSSSRGITTRDRWDCTSADLVLINFIGAKNVSIGSIIELAWADMNRIPSIVVMEPTGNVHDHAMVRELTGFRVDCLQDAIQIIKAILLV